MVQLLLRTGARVDAPGSHGWTPLCLAARSGAADVTKALLAARADVHACSASGKTALEIATINCRAGSRPVLEAIQTEVAASVVEIALRRRPPTPLAAVAPAPARPCLPAPPAPGSARASPTLARAESVLLRARAPCLRRGRMRRSPLEW